MLIKHIKDLAQGKATLGNKRSSKWPNIRSKHLELHPYCSACGGIEKIEVHHIKSFCDHPELELDFNNLLTLCESKSFGITCHQAIGHGGDYKKINPNAVQDAAYVKKMLEGAN
jgi:5-methylcytosine-specific restriction protein A